MGGGVFLLSWSGVPPGGIWRVETPCSGPPGLWGGNWGKGGRGDDGVDDSSLPPEMMQSPPPLPSWGEQTDWVFVWGEGEEHLSHESQYNKRLHSARRPAAWISED